jgi:hypothetical protein
MLMYRALLGLSASTRRRGVVEDGVAVGDDAGVEEGGFGVLTGKFLADASRRPQRTSLRNPGIGPMDVLGRYRRLVSLALRQEAMLG